MYTSVLNLIISFSCQPCCPCMVHLLFPLSFSGCAQWRRPLRILQLLFVFRKSQRFQEFKQSNKYPFDTPKKTLVAERDKWDTSFPKWEMWTWHGHSCSVPVVLFSQRKPSPKCRAVLLFGLGLPSQFGATVAFARHFQTVHWLGCSLVLPQACNCMQDHSTSIPILKFTSFYIHSIPFSCCPNSQKKCCLLSRLSTSKSISGIALGARWVPGAQTLWGLDTVIVSRPPSQPAVVQWMPQLSSWENGENPPWGTRNRSLDDAGWFHGKVSPFELNGSTGWWLGTRATPNKKSLETSFSIFKVLMLQIADLCDGWLCVLPSSNVVWYSLGTKSKIANTARPQPPIPAQDLLAIIGFLLGTIKGCRTIDWRTSFCSETERQTHFVLVPNSLCQSAVNLLSHLSHAYGFFMPTHVFHFGGESSSAHKLLLPPVGYGACSDWRAMWEAHGTWIKRSKYSGQCTFIPGIDMISPGWLRSTNHLGVPLRLTSPIIMYVDVVVKSW